MKTTYIVRIESDVMNIEHSFTTKNAAARYHNTIIDDILVAPDSLVYVIVKRRISCGDEIILWEELHNKKSDNKVIFMNLSYCI